MYKKIPFIREFYFRHVMKQNLTVENRKNYQCTAMMVNTVS